MHSLPTPNNHLPDKFQLECHLSYSISSLQCHKSASSFLHDCQILAWSLQIFWSPPGSMFSWPHKYLYTSHIDGFLSFLNIGIKSKSCVIVNCLCHPDNCNPHIRPKTLPSHIMSIINKHSSLLFWLSNKSCFPSTPILSSVLVPYFASNTNWQDTLIGGQVGDFRSPHMNSIGTSMCSISPQNKEHVDIFPLQFHTAFSVLHQLDHFSQSQ